MKRILLLFLPFLPYLASAQVAKDTVTVLTIADIPAGAIRDTTNITFVQDNSFNKARFDSLARYVTSKLIGDRGDITVSGSTGLTWELDAGVVDSMQLSAGAVVLPGAKVTGTLPVSKGGTGTPTQFTAGSVVFAGSNGIYKQDTSGLFFNDSAKKLGVGTSNPNAVFEVKSLINESSGRPAFFAFRDSDGGGSFLAEDGTGNAGATLPQFTMYSKGITTGGFFMVYVDSTQTNANTIGFSAREFDYTDNSISSVANGNTFRFLNFTTQQLAIASNGDVVIGSTAVPTERLHVVGNARITAVGTASASNSALYITNTGVLSTNSSDVDKKHNIRQLPYGLSTINNLNPVAFNWNDDDSEDIGFVAQDISQHIPETVISNWNGDLIFRQEKIIPVLVKAIQEQQAQIEQLKQRITQLENK